MKGLYYWWWVMQLIKDYNHQFHLTYAPREQMTDYTKCPACGLMSLHKGRCWIRTCSWTDPDWHDPLCMETCCILTEKDEPDAPDTDKTKSLEIADSPGGEAG